MNNKSYCNRWARGPANSHRLAQLLLWAVFAIVLWWSSPVAAGDAPEWMHALVKRPLSPHDEKTEAVLLYEETNVNVLSADKTKTLVRRAYKILRPGGRDYGTVIVTFNATQKVTRLRGWCIPAQGKDYEVRDKDGIEVALPKIEGSELISDVRAKLLQIPAADPGSIIGYEYEIEERPLVLQDIWAVQREIPVQETRFSLALPNGWEYKATWLNHPEVAPTSAGSGQWLWNVAQQKAIRKEEDMPPVRGLAGQMVISYIGPGAANSVGFTNWQQMGKWYRELTAGRTDASPEIKQKAAALTASAPAPLGKMGALAQFVQHDIRYVAIELGIGGVQPHPAAEVFTHHYGDCKDKATLLASMLHEIGVESYYVVINTERGSVTRESPAYNGFDHVILAIKLPAGLSEPSLVATMQHPTLGALLFFDPTDELTPFGQISGNLQANFGLLVGPDSGELVELPKQPSSMNGISRTGKFKLDAAGTLTGDVEEVRVGDRAWTQRYAQRTVSKETERIKPIESLLAGSLASFRITKASVTNLAQVDLPFGFNYSIEAGQYAKTAGNLLLVRPRVLGSKSRAILETREARTFPVEFEGPARDADTFEIVLPPGYEVEDVPPPVDAEFSFASYHSKTEVKGNAIAYTRTFEIKELSVPVSKAEELKRFYRMIASDERNTAVVRPKY